MGPRHLSKSNGSALPLSFPRKRESSRRNTVMQARERCAVTIMASRRACLDPRLRGDDKTRDEDGVPPFIEVQRVRLPHVIPAQAGIQPTELGDASR
jgi:hypothetical protein